MQKVKIFAHATTDGLEEKINQYLKDWSNVLIKIEFSSTSTPSPGGIQYMYSALVHSSPTGI